MLSSRLLNIINSHEEEEIKNCDNEDIQWLEQLKIGNEKTAIKGLVKSRNASVSFSRMCLYSLHKAKNMAKLKLFSRVMMILVKKFALEDAKTFLRTIVLDEYIDNLERGMYKFLCDFVASKEEQYGKYRIHFSIGIPASKNDVFVFKKYFSKLDFALKQIPNGSNEIPIEIVINLNARLARSCKSLIKLEEGMEGIMERIIKPAETLHKILGTFSSFSNFQGNGLFKY